MIPCPPAGSYISLGDVTFRQLLDFMANPTHQVVGFNIVPEDRELWEGFLKQDKKE